MSKMGQELYKRLEENKYKMYEALGLLYRALLFADDPIPQKTILKEFELLSFVLTKIDGGE